MDSGPATDRKRLLSDMSIRSYSSSVLSFSSDIYIEPEKEAAAQRKFDKYLVPVSLIFIILSSLDRNNVSGAPFPESITNCRLAWKCPCLWL
jgi:hypothetical protein